MNEFDRIFGNEFFIIDSNNINSIKTRLYGYTIQNDKVIEMDELDDTQDITPDGAYIFVKVTNEEIIISQDFLGYYGLYVYHVGDYFAISNSFYKLSEYLKNNHPISFNRTYGDSLLFSGFHAYAYGETLVNEIEVLPSQYRIIINKNNKQIVYDEIDYKERTIDINSFKGISIIDKWYYKWTNILRSIKNKTNNMSFNLSGGKDSRLVAALWLTANIDLDKINIKSYTDKNHEIDFKIASDIAKEFNFELNKNEDNSNKNPFNEINTVLNISFYTKLGFHNELYFRYFRFEDTLYQCGGSAGETIRGYYDSTPQEYLDKKLNRINRFNPELVPSTRQILESAIKKAQDDLNISDKNSKEIPDRLAKEVMARNHNGKTGVESYLANIISLAPLVDSDLHKLKIVDENCNDRDLLIALIYQRYCPKLLDFPFDGNTNGITEINPKTVEYAKRINDQYPFKPIYREFISGPNLKDYELKKDNNFKGDVANYLIRDVLNSRSFKLEFEKYYSEKNITEIVKFAQNSKHFPLQQVYAALAILKTIYNTCSSIPSDSNDVEKWLNSFTKEINLPNATTYEIKQLLFKYATARIDLKNVGSKNNKIEILENNDITSNQTKPSWFRGDDGEGIIIESIKGNLDLKVKCVNGGVFKLWLRGPDVRDKNNNRFPIFIDYKKLSINGEEIIKENVLITHDKSFKFSKEVYDSEIISLHIEWLPFNSLSSYNI